MRTAEELLKEAQGEVERRQEDHFKTAAKSLISGIALAQADIKRLNHRITNLGEQLKNLKVEDFADSNCDMNNGKVSTQHSPRNF